MSVSNPKTETMYQKYGWIILLALGILLSLTGLAIAGSPGANMSDFESSTGATWVDWSASEPEAAGYILRLERLIGVGFAGFSLLSTAIVWTGYRQGERRAWYIMWLFPIILGLAAIVFFVEGAPGLGGFYSVAAFVALLALVVTYRKFFPKV